MVAAFSIKAHVTTSIVGCGGMSHSPASCNSSFIERTDLLKRAHRVVISLTAAFLLAFFCYTQTARAQEGHQHIHEPSEKLGEVNFTVSCNLPAQRQFNRAVAWLHSFEYEEAEKAFTEVTATDPRCGMGYWGIAMSNYHPIWAPPTAAELQKGSNAIEKAKAVGARTQLERD